MPTAPGDRPTDPKKSSAYTGRVLARCKVGEKLGRGATSHVFRAHYQPLAKDIALKILSKDASSEDVRQRFTSEARAVAKLNHENIVKVIDVVEDQGFLCILMELAEGPTLQDRVDDEGPLPPRHAFDIAAQIARGLEAAHEEKLVHRDVKPANVMLVGPRGEETVKVVDFGLAAQQEMNRVGTPMFMSPEAAQGKRIDEKSDVYALGICLYYMLTGVLPFTGATVKDILAAQVNVEAVPPSKQRPQLGKAYDDLIKRLLVKSKGYRPSAAEAAELLEQIADDLEEREVGVKKVRKKRKPKPKKAAPPNPALWAGLAIAGVVVVGLAIAFSGGKKPPETPNTAGVTGPTPGTLIKPAVVDPAVTALQDAIDWAMAHPHDLKEQSRRYAAVMQQFPGTVSGTSADVKKAEVDAILKSKEEEQARQPVKPTPPPPESASDDVKYARFKTAIAAMDWNVAYQVAESFQDTPTGVNGDAFERQIKCAEYLSKNWVNVLDAALQEMRPKLDAKAVLPKAKDGETIAGARTSGLFVTDAKGESRTISWAEADAHAFLRRPIADKALTTEDFKNNVLLGALAAMLPGEEKLLKKFRSQALGLANADEAHAEEMTREVNGVLGGE
jgi:tRNA A-37 threonylcarbamoyl transferase component Bud32